MFAEVQEFLSGSTLVSLDRVRAWMLSEDEETLGAVYLALTAHVGRIVPRPDPMSVAHLLLRIMAVARVRPGVRDLSLSPYDAGRCLLGLALSWAAASDSDASARLVLLRDHLEAAYREGDEAFQTRMVHGFLEHAFEHPELRALFAGWRSAPVLCRAYEEAALWADNQPEE